MKLKNENLNEEQNLNMSDVSDSLKNILMTVKKRSKNKRWMGANVDISAFEEGKECVLNILEDITKNEAIDKLLDLYSVGNWVEFDFMKLETRPPKYGKYLITRKDGKIHWETWNGSGWAYNHNEIRYWAEIKPPCL